MTSLLLHTINTLLLFGLPKQMTRAPWQSFFVAAAERALELAQSTRQKQLAEGIRSRLSLYRDGRPYHERR